MNAFMFMPISHFLFENIAHKKGNISLLNTYVFLLLLAQFNSSII